MGIDHGQMYFPHLRSTQGEVLDLDGLYHADRPSPPQNTHQRAKRTQQAVRGTLPGHTHAQYNYKTQHDSTTITHSHHPPQRTHRTKQTADKNKRPTRHPHTTPPTSTVTTPATTTRHTDANRATIPTPVAPLWSPVGRKNRGLENNRGGWSSPIPPVIWP